MCNTAIEYIHRWRGGVAVGPKTWDLRSVGRGFNFHRDKAA